MVFVTAGLGLILLLLAGDALVRGAVNLSLRLGVPALIVSLTIVAFGTSAPELLISVDAALKGVAGIAMGNVVGSNIANVLLVLGIPALIAVMHTSQIDTRKGLWQMLGATALFVALAQRGAFDWISGLALLAALTAMLTSTAVDALRHRAKGQPVDDLEEPEGADPDMPWWKIITFLVAGLIGLPIGADLLVDSASVIALMYGVSEEVIGLTLVAVGTSLPELATTVMAALRRQADVAIGNVIGSNMFNLLGIIGVASLIAPIPVGPGILGFDIWVMVAASLLLIPLILFKRDLTRLWGLGLSVAYVAYISAVFIL